MSPFENAVDQLASRVRGLDLRAQVALFMTAANVMGARWTEWAMATNYLPHAQVFERAVGLASDFATGRAREVPRDALEEVEAATPSDQSDVPGFTTAQDCWICLDTSLRSALGEFDPADSTWYLLEPLFQTVSESRFGYADVGTNGQEAAESAVLADPAVLAAVTAIDRAIELLGSRPIDAMLLDELEVMLKVISP